MELERKIVKVGNSAGVILPREWLNGVAKIKLVEKPLDIKRDVLEILDLYLEEVIGIYLVGSYAREEQRPDSDVDILVISRDTDKVIKSGKYEIEVVSMKRLKWLLEKQPITIYPKFVDAKVILNRGLLEEISELKFELRSFLSYIEECREILNKSLDIVLFDKGKSEFVRGYVVIYSTLLRLKALYIMKCLLGKEKYSNKKFTKWATENSGISRDDFEAMNEVYRKVANGRKPKEKIKLEMAEKLLGLFEREINKYDKKKKAT
jgi:predicted nucleotidyltransferase